MALSQELLDILVCPVPECRVSLKLTADGKGLKCSKCHRVYPINDDIPIMIVDQAKIETE